MSELFEFIDINTLQRQYSSDFDIKGTKDKETIPLEELVKMINNCPINSAALSLLGSIAVNTFGSYNHPDERLHKIGQRYYTKTEFIKSNFDTMQCSIYDVYSKIVKQTIALGFSVAEIVFSSTIEGFENEIRLQNINVLNPLKCKFLLEKNRIKYVVYTGGDKPVKIPYQKVLHIINSRIDNNDPKGFPQAARAYPYYKALRNLLNNMAINMQKCATGVWILKVPSNDSVAEIDEAGNVIKNPDGTPKIIPAIVAAKKAAEEIRNHSVLVTGKEVDTVFNPMSANTGEMIGVADYLTRLILLAYNIPQGVLQDTNMLGQTGVNLGHRLIMDTYLQGVLNQIKESILNNIIRKLFYLNLGPNEVTDLGFFRQEHYDPNLGSLIMGNITSATASGALSSNDPDVINRIREICGLPIKSTQELINESIMNYIAKSQGLIPEDETQ